MEPILEFNYKFEGDEEEHIINIQPKSDSLIRTKAIFNTPVNLH